MLNSAIMKLGLHKLTKIKKGKKRRGRGIGSRGAKSGRGMKGQKSRAGYSRRAGFEGGQTPLYQRVPKKRGSKSRIFKLMVRSHEVMTNDLDRFASGSVVGLGALQKMGLIKESGKKRPVKLVSAGAVKNKLTVRVHAATKQAVKQVEAAGGKVEIIVR